MNVSNSTPGIFNSRQRQYLAATAFGLLMLGGCASTTTVGSDGQPSIEPLMSQAESELSKGRREQAIALLNQAAKESPTSVAPWLKIANIWFDDANYPSTILAANEAIARDADNQEAKSLLVVSGLRVAARAVQGLVPHNPVNPNARQEAENLTKSLRLALGEKVLVPADSDKAAASSQRPRKKVVRAQPVAKVAANPAAVPATVSAAPAVAAPALAQPKISVSVQPQVSVSADPFKSLK